MEGKAMGYNERQIAWHPGGRRNDNDDRRRRNDCDENRRDRRR
jgi:hypothetical protein